MSDIVGDLISEMDRMPIVDAHEHLDTEEEMLARPVDVFNRLTMYTYADAVSAGMTAGIVELRDDSIPIEQRWTKFSPYLDAIRDTGCYRQLQVAIRDLYGIEDLNDETYLLVQEKMEAVTKPGFYDWILKEKCHIVRILNQGSWNDGKRGFAVGVSREFTNLLNYTPAMHRAFYRKWTDAHGGQFEDPLEFVEFILGQISARHVGLKTWAGVPCEKIQDAEAARLFKRTRTSEATEGEYHRLAVWLTHKALERASAHDLVVAAHCGINASCWVDFRKQNPLNIVKLAMAYRDTRFDLYHGGIPWVREIAVIANQCPNVHLNLTWCHQLSPYMTEGMLNEWIDLVPSNKIIGFGGDHSLGVEKIYGALQLAKENIARALAVRVRRGHMSQRRAVDMCRRWLYDNPKRIYGLS